MNPFYLNYVKRLVADYRVCARTRLATVKGLVLCEKGEILSTTSWLEINKRLDPEYIVNAISIVGEYTADTLYTDFLSVIQQDPFTSEYFLEAQHKSLLQTLLSQVCKYPELTQHLTLLNIFMPTSFARAVFCAWFATLVYLEAETEKKDLQDIFIAALCHDLGLLHLDPDVLQQNRNGERQPGYYKHIEIAANLLNELSGISRESVRAVMEHHEHLDGTGHPRGLGSTQLSFAGQYIHLLDNLFAIYNQYFKPRGKSLCDTIPIVEMNSISHFGHTAKATINILQKGTRTEGTLIPPNMLKPLIQDIKTRYNYITFANDIIQQFTHAVGFRHDDRALFMLQNSFIHIALTLDKSRLLNPAYMRWLDHVMEFGVKREHHLIEVAFLMTNEVIYHIEKFRNQLVLYKGFCKVKTVLIHVERALKQFQQQPLPRVKNSLTFL